MMDTIYLLMEYNPEGGYLLGWDTTREAVEAMAVRHFANMRACSERPRLARFREAATDAVLTWENGQAKLPIGVRWMQIETRKRGEYLHWMESVAQDQSDAS